MVIVKIDRGKGKKLQRKYFFASATYSRFACLIYNCWLINAEKN